MEKIYVYMKKRDSFDVIQPLILNATHGRPEEYDLYTDVNRDYLAYREMKKNLLQEKGFLIISSIKNIGTNHTEIYEELLWFKENEIPVAFADYPATHIFDNEMANSIALNVLVDVYSSLKDDNLFDIHNKTAKKKSGRKKLNFPENWAELYARWENGDITAKKFMELAGLKKGTFYHLVVEYRELLEMNKEVMKLG